MAGCSQYRLRLWVQMRVPRQPLQHQEFWVEAQESLFLMSFSDDSTHTSLGNTLVSKNMTLLLLAELEDGD